MSNLSDLLPAGASGKTIEATATATITSKAPVILNSAGTVTEVGESTGSESLGSPVVASTGTTIYQKSAVYDAASGKMVLVYIDNSSKDVFAAVGTISGTTISWGTPVTVAGAITADNHPQICYDPDTEQVIIAYEVQSAQTYVVTGKVSGTTISFGTPVAIDSATGMWDFTVAYNVAESKGLVVYGSGSLGSFSGRAKVITVTGTAISLGVVEYWNTSAYVNNNHFCATYDSNAGSIVFANQSNANTGKAAVFTISGTTVSAGTFTQYTTGNTTGTSITYDSTSQKIVTASRETSTTYGSSAVGTVSGTSISFGTPVTFESSNVTADSVRCAYGGTAAGAVTNIVFAPTSDNYQRYINGTVSGTSISFNTAARAYSDNATTSSGNISTATSGKVLLIIVPSSTVGGLTDNYVYGAVLQNVATTTNLTSTNFVGIADAGIATSATGTIVVQGGTATGLTSLTIASNYYVQNDGTITTVSSSVNAGLAISTTSLLLNGDS